MIGQILLKKIIITVRDFYHFIFETKKLSIKAKIENLRIDYSRVLVSRSFEKLRLTTCWLELCKLCMAIYQLSQRILNIRFFMKEVSIFYVWGHKFNLHTSSQWLYLVDIWDIAQFFSYSCIVCMYTCVYSEPKKKFTHVIYFGVGPFLWNLIDPAIY